MVAALHMPQAPALLAVIVTITELTISIPTDFSTDAFDCRGLCAVQQRRILACPGTSVKICNVLVYSCLWSMTIAYFWKEYTFPVCDSIVRWTLENFATQGYQAQCDRVDPLRAASAASSAPFLLRGRQFCGCY